MNRDLLATHLKQAERHVVEGEEHIARQRELIVRLERQGHDIESAVKLLSTFEQTQASHIADRDRLRAELSETQ